MKKISIIGTVGVPARYGGFETLVENLVKHHAFSNTSEVITVYCSSRSYPSREPAYLSAQLIYVPLKANGAQSIMYDMYSLFLAIWNRSGVILLLGVSGAIALPIVRLLSSAKIVTNIDGIEWRREKWQGVAKRFLRFSERMAVHFSHEVIADNAAIAEYVQETYDVRAHVIAYGGDHALSVDAASLTSYELPESYAFLVCRIEPENNVHVVLDAFSTHKGLPLVIVGNWGNCQYGRDLRLRYGNQGGVFLLDPIYDLGKLKSLRQRMSCYVHGHSAGGTNPSLVEAMHFGKPVLAFDCEFNRATTESKALFFRDAAHLQELLDALEADVAQEVGREMREIARRRYTWDVVARQYFDLILFPAQ